MGQTLTSELPPNHRLGEHYIPYDANAWRRLSQTYLNELLANGQLSKEDMDMIYLEHYWHQRRRGKRRRPISYSLNPVHRRYNRSVSKPNLNHGSFTNIADSRDDFLPGHDRNGKRPSWKHLQQSSHLTKNNRYHYHSLANLSTIQPNREQLNTLASNLKYSQRNHNNNNNNQSGRSQQQRRPPFLIGTNGSSPWIHQTRQNDSNKNSSSNTNYAPNHLHHSNYIRPEDIIFNNSPKNIAEPKRTFQEYSSKNKWDNPSRSPSVDMDRTSTLPLKSCLRDSSPSISKRSSSISSPFSRGETDSTRTTIEKQDFTIEHGDNERLVASRPPSESSFQRKQKQSTAPEFRVISTSLGRLTPKFYDSNHQQPTNHVHFKHNKDHYIQTEDDENFTDEENEEDEYFDRRHQQGSLRLMRPCQSNYNGNTKKRGDSLLSSKPLPLKQNYINYRGYNLDPENTLYSNYYQSFDRPNVGFTKIIFILLLLANIGSVIWNSIYMHFACIKIQLGEPIHGRIYAMEPGVLNAWQGSVIAAEVFNCLLSMFAIYATIREKYWPIWTFTILFYMIGSFSSFTELLRGSVSAWLLPMICGHCGVMITHQIAINHYSIKY